MPFDLAAAGWFLDTGACRAWLLERFHPDGVGCPWCGAVPSCRQLGAFRDGGRVNCAGCGRWYSWRSGTPLHRSTANESQLVLYLLLRAAGCAKKVIREAVGLSAETLRLWGQRF